MLRSEARHASLGLILDLDGQIRPAHERLPQQIDAVPHVQRGTHEGRLLCVSDCPLRASGIVQGPVTVADAVL